MEIEFFFDGSYLCLSVYTSAVLVVLFWFCLLWYCMYIGIIYHADVPVYTLLQADTNISQDRDTAAGD